jgi:hypothetical protein
LSFLAAVNRNSVTNALTLKDRSGALASYAAITYENNDSTVVVSPTLSAIQKYTLSVTTALKSTKGGNLQSGVDVTLTTAIDPNDKFPAISDDALLELIQKQTFKYFYDFGHPTSGLARERNSSADIVTTGGSGFGIMAMVVGVNRGFISPCRWFGQDAKDSGFP